MDNNITMNESTDSGDDRNADQGRHDGSSDDPGWSLDNNSGQNPLLISNILHQVFEHLPPTSLLKLRRVCRLWNELLVPKINKSESVGLVKIINRDEESKNLKLPFIDIKEVAVTMEAGGLEHSIMSRIYFDDSMEHNLDLLQVFLDMNGKNIRTLHYDGNSMELLGRIFKSCSQNLVNLSLWNLMDPQKTWYKRNKSSNLRGNLEIGKEGQIEFPKLESIVLVSGDDLHAHMSVDRDEYDDDSDSDSLEGIIFYPIGGQCNPSQKFLEGIMRASPKFNSLSARLCDSSILEALAETNSFIKLSTLCIKSRIDISQLRVLCSAGAEMKLKNLILRGLCVVLGDSNHDDFGINTEDPNYKRHILKKSEIKEFAPLVLEFLKTQANSLEFLSLHLFNIRQLSGNIPVNELFIKLPAMPNLITLIFDKIENRINLFKLSTLFPNLKNLGQIPSHWKENRKWFDDDDSGGEWVDHEIRKDVRDISWIEEFPLLIIPTPESSSSFENLLGLNPTLDLVQQFPGITEFHSTITFAYAPLPHELPILCPLLKHLYFHIDLLNVDSENVIKFIRRFNMFMVGINPWECEAMEHMNYSFSEIEFHKIQLARSRPSVFDLKDLETLEVRFSCFDFEISSDVTSIQPSLDVLTTCGLSRMKQLKKLYFELNFNPNPRKRQEVPDSLRRLMDNFNTEENFNTRSHGFAGKILDSEAGACTSAKQFVMEFNVDHHTSEWKQLNFFPDDPDIYDLGLEKEKRINYVQKPFYNLP